MKTNNIYQRKVEDEKGYIYIRKGERNKLTILKTRSGKRHGKRIYGGGRWEVFR